MTDCFRVRQDGAKATVTLTARTMTPSFFRELEEVVDDLEARDGLRVVIVDAEHPKAFSYGLDLPAAFAKWGKLFQGQGLARGRKELLALIRTLQRPFDRLAALRVPTIAAVHGWCLGGGVDLVCACDMRLASTDAVFSVRETRIAIVADLGSLQRLPLIVGHAHARELALTGRDFDAAYAERVGFVSRTLPSREALADAAHALADEIAANAPLVVQGVKALMHRATEAQVADGLEHVAVYNAAFLPSEDLAEAVSAYMGKRPPDFKGR